MIVKSFEVKKNKSSLPNNNFFLLYGENLGLKKDIKYFPERIMDINQLAKSFKVKWRGHTETSNYSFE